MKIKTEGVLTRYQVLDKGILFSLSDANFIDDIVIYAEHKQLDQIEEAQGKLVNVDVECVAAECSNQMFLDAIEVVGDQPQREAFYI